MSDFEYKSLFAQRKMALAELQQYYRDLRKYECEENLPVKGIELRKKIYFLVKFFLKIDKLLQNRTVNIIADKRIKNNKSKIYACTHIGRFDIESAIEAINESAWFIMGDPGETYRNLDGLILRMYGISWFDMGNTPELRYDAHTVNERQIKILSSGGNEMCFPEAAWNIDPVLPVGEINPGIVKRAIKTGAEIIPIGIEQYRDGNKKNYYVNIGENIDLTGVNLSDSLNIAEDIRSIMASLKWDIWEQFGNQKQSEITDNWDVEYEKFIDSIMCDSENGYTIEEIEKTKYHRPDYKPVEKEEQVFEILANVELNEKNAFLAKNVMSLVKVKC